MIIKTFKVDPKEEIEFEEFIQLEEDLQNVKAYVPMIQNVMKTFDGVNLDEKETVSIRKDLPSVVLTDLSKAIIQFSDDNGKSKVTLELTI